MKKYFSFSYYPIFIRIGAGTLFIMGTILVISSTVMYGQYAKPDSAIPSPNPQASKRKSSPVANY